MLIIQCGWITTPNNNQMPPGYYHIGTTQYYFDENGNYEIRSYKTYENELIPSENAKGIWKVDNGDLKIKRESWRSFDYNSDWSDWNNINSSYWTEGEIIDINDKRVQLEKCYDLWDDDEGKKCSTKNYEFNETNEFFTPNECNNKCTF